MNKACLALTFLILSFVSCSNDNDDFNALNTDTRWWILTRPDNDNNGVSEIVLYNETKSIIERTIDLPKKIESPHALEFDGEFLWLGGMGENESIYKLNPEDGTVVSEIANIRTEGIAYLNGELYYSFFDRIFQISQDGTPVQEIALSTNYNPSDIAISNSTLYYVNNTGLAQIIKTNPDEETIAETEISGLFTLTIQNSNLVVTTNTNAIGRFDINSGERISNTQTIIEGWITGIVAYDK